MPFMMAPGSPRVDSAAARASTTLVTSPVAGSMPMIAVVQATLASTRPPDQARSFSPWTRFPAQRTLMSPRGCRVSGSRRTSSLVPSLVMTSLSVAQMPQPSRL